MGLDSQGKQWRKKSLPVSGREKRKVTILKYNQNVLFSLPKVLLKKANRANQSGFCQSLSHTDKGNMQHHPPPNLPVLPGDWGPRTACEGDSQGHRSTESLRLTRISMLATHAFPQHQQGPCVTTGSYNGKTAKLRLYLRFLRENQKLTEETKQGTAEKFSL